VLGIARDERERSERTTLGELHVHAVGSIARAVEAMRVWCLADVCARRKASLRKNHNARWLRRRQSRRG
jgi:hypothetical protein